MLHEAFWKKDIRKLRVPIENARPKDQRKEEKEKVPPRKENERKLTHHSLLLLLPSPLGLGS